MILLGAILTCLPSLFALQRALTFDHLLLYLYYKLKNIFTAQMRYKESGIEPYIFH